MALNNLGLGFTLTAKDAASGVFRSIGSALNKLAEDSEKTRKRIADVGQEMQSIGKVLVGAGAAGFAGLGVAAKASGDFEVAVAKVQTIADSAVFPLGMLRDTGFQMAQAYGGTLENQMAAVYSAIGSGAETAADATAVMHSANQLAIGGLSTVDKTMTLLMGTMNAYSMDLADAQKVSDSFFQAVMIGGSDMSVESLVASLSGVTPIASAAGVKIDEVLGALGRLTAVGIPTAQAVTGVKAAIEGIMKPSTKAIAEAKRLGIQFDGAALRSKGLSKMITEITTSAKFNSKTMQNLFESIDGLSAALALGTNGGEDFDKMMDSMSKAGGTTAEAMRILNETGNVTAGQLVSKVGIALVKIGDVITPLIGKIIKLADVFVSGFNNLPDPVIRVITVGLALASAFAVLLGAAMFIGGSFAALATVGEAVGIAFGVLVVATGGVGIAIAAAAATFYVFRAAYEQNLGRFASIVNGLYAQAKLAFDALSQLFTDGGFSGAVREEMGKAENSGIRQFAIQVFMWGSRIMNFFQQIGTEISRGMALLGPTFDALSMSFLKLVGAFSFGQDGAEKSAESFDTFGLAGSRVGSVIVMALDFIVGGITRVIGFVTALVGGFKSVMPGATNLRILGAAVANAFDLLAAAFGQTGTQGQGAGAGINGVGKALGWVIGLVAQVLVFGAQIIAGIAGPVISGISGVISVVLGFLSIFTGVWNVLAGLLTGDWDQMWGGMKQVVFGVVQAISGVIGAIVSQIAHAIDFLGRFTGKDWGAAKAVEATKGMVLDDVAGVLGMKRDATTPLEARGPAKSEGPQLFKPGQGLGGINQSPMAMPAAAAAEAAAGEATRWGLPQMSPASATSQAPPVQMTSNITLQVDGEVLANTVQKYSTDGSNRSFGPTPSSS